MLKKAKQLIRIKSGKIWKFFGGIKAPQLKYAAEDPIEELGIPALITLPVDRHLDENGQILVASGDYVLRGQALTAPDPKGRLVPLHASTSGTVLHIAPQLLPHPSGFTGTCITIKPDGLDNCVDPQPLNDWSTLDNATILDQIRKMGVEGMGGALFQTAAKLGSAIRDNINGCSVFIINGCECEPALSCDDRLMREKADDIAQGIRIIQKLINPEITLVAIEDNKPEAIKAMSEAVADIAQVRVLPSRYPEGSARSLIKALTGLEIPYDVHTSETGIVVNNVATVLAVKEAVIDGLAVTDRVITVIGQSLGRHGNARVRLGTSVRFILSNFHLNPDFRQRIIMGGPMMGFTLPSIDVPVTKATAAIMAPSQNEIPYPQPSQNCIRCGRCARVCPSRLVPYQMYAFSRAGDHAKATKCGINDCVLCGCCAFECPSRINLTVQFRREQAISAIICENEKRNQRAQEVAREHEKKEEERKKRLAEKKAAALARIKAGGGAKKAAAELKDPAGPAKDATQKDDSKITAVSASDTASRAENKSASTPRKASLSAEELAERRKKALLAAKERREALAKKKAEMPAVSNDTDIASQKQPLSADEKKNVSQKADSTDADTKNVSEEPVDTASEKENIIAEHKAAADRAESVSNAVNPYIKKAPASIFANVKAQASGKNRKDSAGRSSSGKTQTLSDAALNSKKNEASNLNTLDSDKIPSSLKAEIKKAPSPLPDSLRRGNTAHNIPKTRTWDAPDPETLSDTKLAIVGTKDSDNKADSAHQGLFNADTDTPARECRLPQNLKKSRRAK